MPVNVNESFVVEKALDYAKLSDLSYAKWKWVESTKEWILDPVETNNKYIGLWEQLAREGYKVLNFKDDTQGTGYSGTLFYNAETKRTILANRGIDGRTTDDSTAFSNIMNYKVPSEQFRSMVDFITFCQTDLNILLDTFDVIGHSLGGCLAQMAKAAYFQRVLDVYTYNAPGALNLSQNYNYVGVSETQGNVIVKDTSLVAQPVEWRKGKWGQVLYFNILNDMRCSWLDLYA